MRLSFLLSAMLLLLLPCAVTAGMQDWSPTTSVQVTLPQKVSVSIGFCGADWGDLWGPGSGALLRIEPGLSGGKLHLGVRHVFSMLFIPVVSADLTASALYTWNDPWGGLENDQTYAGLEARFGAHLMVVTAGIYRHVGGADTENDWHFSMGAGLGF